MGNEDFEKLKTYEDELVINDRDKIVMKSAHLIEIRNFLVQCDNSVNTPFQICFLLVTAHYWEKCRQFWSKWKPTTETVTEIQELILKSKKLPARGTKEQAQVLVKTKRLPDKPAEKPWEITANDKRFLKSLRITRDDETE